ncbi:MAG: hypothetical protein A3K19_16280 [Lentisphaerae bacterium RIFOXYB12_FULL_65_16]|nr:MAG: hypothetical protein A3K18_20585 [Lentisphaerae bacterium RIFOXYA12_64_32]OGV84492.1 MAG: hypothetical protein A3K19_16280 [Lentisphaerae bacterium RIFOXYB12_FULL_65_16]
MRMLLLALGIAACLGVVLFLWSVAKWQRRFRCSHCLDGENFAQLPEVGVHGTALCVRCPTCKRYFVNDATSKIIEVIDETQALTDYTSARTSKSGSVSFAKKEE